MSSTTEKIFAIIHHPIAPSLILGVKTTNPNTGKSEFGLPKRGSSNIFDYVKYKNVTRSNLVYHNDNEGVAVYNIPDSTVNFDDLKDVSWITWDSLTNPSVTAEWQLYSEIYKSFVEHYRYYYQ